MKLNKLSQYKYSKDEKEFLKVLKYQQLVLEDVGKQSQSSKKRLNQQILSSEELLTSLGYQLPSKAKMTENKEGQIGSKKELTILSWEQLVEKANQHVQDDIVFEDILTADEIAENREVLKALNAEYKAIYSLDTFDILLGVGSGILASLVDILLIGMPTKSADAGPLANFVRDRFKAVFPPGEMENLEFAKVPFDAQDNRNTDRIINGLSPHYHRLYSLGHDPLLGLIFGVRDIMNGQMTVIDKFGKIVIQDMPNYSDRKEANIFLAIAKLLVHFKSDITTSMGLPAPLMGLFNLLQFGQIGEEEETIAQIVQGMYYDGYDFIHFATMSIPVMIIEVLVRVGYACRRMSQGASLSDAVAFSTDRKKYPKLGTILFTAHSVSTAVNLGKIIITKNPLAINYPQWLAFFNYSFQEVHYRLFLEPEQKRKFFEENDDLQYDQIYSDIDTIFDEVLEGYQLTI
ncbi:hypothetical protein [Streptococcus suis]|uniref:hypothetical protein n=1 Tax=Streptococcus suis TaxID=1307 RepID=UPI001C2E1365|nr:hypothetical protein [Streptococcus suis]